MPAGSTYTPIATTTLGSSAASVTFNSFSGYTDLRLVFNGTCAAAGNIHVQFNGDTSAKYSQTGIYGNGSSAGSSRSRASANSYLGTITSTLGTVTGDFMNYSNSTTYKTTLSRASVQGYEVQARIGLWQSTAAITSMLIFCDGGNFQTGSTFTLYGIAAA